MGKRVLSIMAFAAYAFAAFAQFAGGSGTEKDPYLISDAYQLSDMRNYRTSYYKLMNDIDLSEWIAENSPTAGWMPVGTKESPFSGFLDGNNCTIRGLLINRPETSYIGLFGYVTTSGTIVNNLNVDKPSIKGYNYVGTILGYSKDKQSNILNCNIKECSIEGNQYSGGVGGYIGNVTDSYVSVKKIRGQNYCGGISGGNKDCYNCNVLVESIIGKNYIGGVSGSNGTNNNCNAYINEIKGDELVGGISGYCISSTSNCSVIATEIEGNSNCGGIIGRWNSYYSKVEKCYAAANIIGDNIGGIVGLGYYYDSTWFNSSSTPATHQFIDLPISDCRFDGDLISSSGGVGGILGYSQKNERAYRKDGYNDYTHYLHHGMNVYNCISTGDFISNKESVAAGICSSTNGHKVENCVSVYNSISGAKAYRIADPDGAN